MKKLFAAIVVLVAVIAGLMVWNHQLTAKQSAISSTKTLVIYNWGDYIDPSLIKKFEKQTGYQVDYETFDSNEAMLTKIEQGGTRYDLVVPSEYTIHWITAKFLIWSTWHRNFWIKVLIRIISTRSLISGGL